HLDDLRDVNAGECHRDRQLDRQFVARRGGAFDGGAEPSGDLGAAGISDAVVDLAGAWVGWGIRSIAQFRLLDKTVTLEPVERVVDLANVERPRRSGAAVKLTAQLVAVARPLIEDGEEALTNRHCWPFDKE